MIRRLVLLAFSVASVAIAAQELSVQSLLGEWEFTAYAEIDSPDERTPVGVVFEFRPNGVVITKRSGGDIESAYSVDGNTFRFLDENGEQVWTVRAFEPGVSITMENRSTIMYLERR